MKVTHCSFLCFETLFSFRNDSFSFDWRLKCCSLCMRRTKLLAKACQAFFLQESGCSDSSSTFHLVDIHYTHGRWCCRGSSSLKSAVSFLERLRSTDFTSAARAQNTVSSPIQGHALGNCLSPQGRKKEARFALFHVHLPGPAKPVTRLNMASMYSDTKLQFSWLRGLSQLEILKPRFLVLY